MVDCHKIALQFGRRQVTISEIIAFLIFIVLQISNVDLQCFYIKLTSELYRKKFYIILVSDYRMLYF